MEAFPELPPKGTGFCLSPQSGKTFPHWGYKFFSGYPDQMWERVGGGSPALPYRVCYVGLVGQTWVSSHFPG